MPVSPFPLQGEGRMGVDYLLDAGRYGLPVLTRHFPHPVGRFHQHDDKDTYSEVP